MTVAPAFRKISALISDVDGTIVTDDKVVTPRACAAVEALRARGIAFAIVSSRPPRGLAGLVDALQITTPVAGFNGAVIAAPQGDVLEEHLLALAAARQCIELLEAKGAQAWVFSGREWFVRDARAPRVQHEKANLNFEPTVVRAFGPDLLGATAKIVGVSEDRGLLVKCETDIRALLGAEGTIALSPHFFLDISAALANKGAAVAALARHLGVPMEEIITMGDGANDIAMFEGPGPSIAMGNAAAEVQRGADFVTASNNDDGFAQAIERIVLGGLLKSDERD